MSTRYDFKIFKFQFPFLLLILTLIVAVSSPSYAYGAGGTVTIESTGDVYNTLEAAIAASTEGDILKINGEIDLTTQVTINKERITIDGIGKSGTINMTGNGQITVSASNVTIQDLNIVKNDNTNAKSYVIHGGKKAEGVKIIGNEITSASATNGKGVVYFDGAPDVQITDNIISSSAANAIRLNNCEGNTLIDKNTINMDTDKWFGISASPGANAESFTISNNTINGPCKFGIVTDHANDNLGNETGSAATIKDNIFSGEFDVAIWASGSGEKIQDNNLHEANCSVTQLNLANGKNGGTDISGNTFAPVTSEDFPVITIKDYIIDTLENNTFELDGIEKFIIIKYGDKNISNVPSALENDVILTDTTIVPLEGNYTDDGENIIFELNAPEINTFEVKFISDGKVISTIQYINEELLNSKPIPPNPSKSGYRFTGWYLKDTNTLIDLTLPVTDDMEFEARWVLRNNSSTGNSTGSSSGSSSSDNSSSDNSSQDDSSQDDSSQDDSSSTESTAESEDTDRTIESERIPAGTVRVELKPYIIGYGDNIVSPNGLLTRAELAQILYNLHYDGDDFISVSDRYTDVKENHWFYDAVEFVSEKKYMIGYGDGTFKPNQSVTRAELCTVYSILLNLDERKESGFLDITNHWAKEYIERLYNESIVTGYGDNFFRPDNYITRAEAVVIINRSEGYDGEFKTDKTFNDLPSTYWAYRDMMTASNGCVK